MPSKTKCSLSWSVASLVLPVILGAQTTTTITNTSSGNYRGIVAPSSLVSGWGSGFSATTATANSNPPVSLPTALGGVSLSGVDSSNTTFSPMLYLVSPGQINYVLPANVGLGRATIAVSSGNSSVASGVVYISNVAPAIFTADGSGNGVPAAQILRVNAANTQSGFESPYLSGTSTYQPRPIDVSSTDRVYLILYGTGIRNHSLNPVIATVNGTSVPVTYAGAQSTYPGLDQVNVGPLPASLVGSGTVNAVILVDGVPANTVQVAFK